MRYRLAYTLEFQAFSILNTVKFTVDSSWCRTYNKAYSKCVPIQGTNELRYKKRGIMYV